MSHHHWHGGPRILTGTGPGEMVRRGELKDAVRELFADDADIALLYFAGHGHIEDTGGFLCAGDCKTGDEGFSLGELMTLASKSKRPFNSEVQRADFWR